MPQTSTPKPRQKKSSRKRGHSYKEANTSTSESPDENQNQSTSEEEIEKKKTKKTSTKKKPVGKTKTPKIIAKDGRKLVDLSNRIRNEKGRILGYKPETRSTAKRSGCKDSPTMTPQAKPTTEPQQILEQTSHAMHETYSKRVRMKMPSEISALATPQLKAEVRKILSNATQLPTPDDFQQVCRSTFCKK